MYWAGVTTDRDTPVVHLAGWAAHEVASVVVGHRQLLHPEPRAEGALPVAVQAGLSVCGALPVIIVKLNRSHLTSVPESRSL